ASARAISSRFWRPSGRLPAGTSATSPSPTRSSSARARARASASSRRTPGAPTAAERIPPRRLAWAPTSTLSSAESARKTSVFWNVRPTPAWAMRCGLSCVSSIPAKVNRPRWGRYRPVRTLKTVVFPAPLGPIRPKISPSPTSKPTPLSAARPPKAMARSSTARIGTLVGLQPVGELLEAALLHRHPETLALRLVVGADSDRRQDAAVPALDPLERGDEAVARERAAGPLGALGEEHGGEVAGQRVAVDLVLRKVLLHRLAVRFHAAQIRRDGIGPERQPLHALGGVAGQGQVALVGQRARGDHHRIGPADLLTLLERLGAGRRRQHEER